MKKSPPAVRMHRSPSASWKCTAFSHDATTPKPVRWCCLHVRGALRLRCGLTVSWFGWYTTEPCKYKNACSLVSVRRGSVRPDEKASPSGRTRSRTMSSAGGDSGGGAVIDDDEDDIEAQDEEVRGLSGLCDLRGPVTCLTRGWVRRFSTGHRSPGEAKGGACTASSTCRRGRGEGR